MRKIFNYELKRFRKERGVIFTLSLILLSLYLSFRYVAMYEGYQEDVIKPFQEKEMRIFEITNNYRTYSVKGFNALMQPACSSVSVDPTAYESVINTKLDVNMDNRFTEVATKKKSVDIPFLLIFMVAGFYYGASIIFVAVSRVKTFLVRMLMLLSAVVLVILPRLVSLHFIPATSDDFYISLQYWLMVLILTGVAYCLGTTSRLFNVRKNIALSTFILLLFGLHVLSGFVTPDRLSVDDEVHGRKFKDMMDFQKREDLKLKGIENKENVKALRLDIAKRFIYEVFPGMVNYQKGFVKLAEKIDRKIADIAIISPLDYDQVFKSAGTKGNQHHFALKMIDLEYQFLKYTWEKMYSPEKPEFKKFEGAEMNVYSAKAALPYNFNTALTVYSLLLIGLVSFSVVKIGKKVESGDKLDIAPGFRHLPELSDSEREEVKQRAIVNGYFCVDDETVFSYPSNLTLSEVLFIDDKTKAVLKDKVGDYFDSKIKTLYAGDLIISATVAAVLLHDNIVIDNIANGYPIHIKRKFTYLVDELKREEQVILYLSNNDTTLNMTDPPECDGVEDIEGPLKIDTEYEIV